jgi:pyruvate kinase
MSRTKIICTIGPAVNSLEKILQLIKAGMNVARLNFSHGTQEGHLHTINLLKEARKKAGVSLAIMLDTKGPEIRLGKVKDGEISLPAGHQWLLTKESVEGTLESISINPGSLLDAVPLGAKILFDDGYIASHVIEKRQDGLIVEIANGGKIKSGKGVNIPNVSLNLPAVTEKDVDDIKFGCKHDVDVIAASFIRSPEHVLSIKKILSEQKRSDILVFAKIENPEGVQNFDSIIVVADGIMIARGDLGVEVPLSQVPRLQKMMIRKCYLAGKPSVTATQMLESMINNPRPTRAETSDVANAVYDSTSLVMLSGETAVGRYPIETVNVMKSIIKETEADFHYREFFDQYARLVYHDVPSSVTLAGVKTAYASNATAILAFTSGGSTARLLSRLRPEMPIIALTPNEKCYHQLSLNWGVVPFHSHTFSSFKEAFDTASKFGIEHNYVSYGDLVVLIAGSTFGIPGTTNMMIVENIGDVLVRGYKGYGARVHGNVMLVLSPENKREYEVRGQILVFTKFDDSYMPLMREALGVVLQNNMDDVDSENYLLKMANILDIPALVRADGAFRVLKEGQLITLDPTKRLVYKGVVLSD